MSETTNNGVCPHCDMGIVPTGSKLPWTIKFRKCSICHGDWRNYVKKPEPQPDVHPTNHMNALPPMEEHLVSQFNSLSQKESDAYNEMMGTKFLKPDVSWITVEEMNKISNRLREDGKKREAAEYNQLMDLTLTYQWEDVRSIQCPVCCTGGFGCTPYTKCQVCRGGGYVKVVVIRPPKP